MDVSFPVIMSVVPDSYILMTRFVTLFWPKKVRAAKLEEIHAKMVMKEAAPRSSGDAAMKRPKPSVPTKSNGSMMGSSSYHMNGKPHR